MSMLDDIKIYLVANGQNTNLIHKSKVPDVEPSDTEVTTVTLFQYGGVESEYVHDSVKPAMENPRLQVHCRAMRDQDAEAQAYVIWNLLTRIVNATINGHEYVRVTSITSPFYLQRDEADRSIWTCNYRVKKGVE